MSPSSATTRRARQATSADLAVSVPPTHIVCGKTFSFAVKTTTEMSNDERAQVWHMFEENMHELYSDSSFGWNPLMKRKEMFSALSRFVIARQVPDATGLAGPAGIVAYSIFRFEREDHQDVVYCYELQVSRHSRRFGLGRVLMQMLSDIGARWDMVKVMLTVFKANQSALLFYRSTGFTTDESSPDFSDGCGGEDYSIMSRRISSS